MTAIAMTETQTRPEPQRRRHLRHDYATTCTLKSVHKTWRAKTLNISQGGVCIKLQSFGSMEEGAVVAIELDDFPLINGVAVWVNNRIIGLEFIDDVQDHREIAALLARFAGR